MSRRFFALLGLFLLVSFATAHAAEPPVPGACPPKGTYMTFSEGSTITISDGADGLACPGRNRGKPFVRYGQLWSTDGFEFANDWIKPAIAKIWPLEVGKTAGVVQPIKDYMSSTSQLMLTWTVTAKKQVTVAAGTFDVFEVLYDAHNAGYGGGMFHRQLVMDIATDLGYVVKSAPTSQSTVRKDAPWELVSFIKGQP